MVLTHDKADLEDQVSRMPSVCWIRGNRKQRETRLHGALDTLLKGLDKEKESQTAGVSSMIESFGTWDSVEYSGGYKEFGDFDTIPDGWDREVGSVFEVSGGITLLRGPRIKTTLKRRMGLPESIHPQKVLSRTLQALGRKGHGIPGRTTQ